MGGGGARTDINDVNSETNRKNIITPLMTVTGRKVTEVMKFTHTDTHTHTHTHTHSDTHTYPKTRERTTLGYIPDPPETV